MGENKNIETLFGKVLRDYREKNGLSQAKLAEICRLDRTYISLLERGKRQPTLKTIFVLAEALHISPSTLIKSVEELRNEDY